MHLFNGDRHIVQWRIGLAAGGGDGVQIFLIWDCWKGNGEEGLLPLLLASCKLTRPQPLLRSPENF